MNLLRWAPSHEWITMLIKKGFVPLYCMLNKCSQLTWPLYQFDTMPSLILWLRALPPCKLIHLYPKYHAAGFFFFNCTVCGFYKLVFRASTSRGHFNPPLLESGWGNRKDLWKSSLGHDSERRAYVWLGWRGVNYNSSSLSLV